MLNRLRTALFSVFVVVATLVIALVFLPTLLIGRGAAFGAVRFWARTMLAGLRAICGIRHVVEGAENIPKGAAIVAANHQSMWETIAFFAFLPKPVFVLKKELLKIPVYGWWAGAVKFIAVDRSAGAKAIRALTREAEARLAEGAQIVLFPEGTRVPLGERRPLQPGVAAIYLAGGAPATPVVHNSGRHWRFPGGLGSLKIPGVITVRFAPAIAPGLERKAFLKALEAHIVGGRDDLSAGAVSAAQEAPADRARA